MPEVTIRVNSKAAGELARDIRLAKGILVGQLAERGYQLLRSEVPVKTGNLKQGVAPPEVDFDTGTATLTVSARTGRLGPRQATVYGKDGQAKKTLTLKPSRAYNYAASVALGRPSITTKRSAIERTGNTAIGPGFNRALLIPVPTAPTGEGYLVADGQVYIFRRSAKATKPNPFHERAAKRLEGEAAKIGDAVLRKIFV